MGKRHDRYRFRMGGTNSTLVCPECRIAARGNVKCAQCGLPLMHLGHKWRVPKKQDDAGWKKVIKLLGGQKVLDQRQKDKVVLLIEKGTHEEFKACVQEFFD